MITKGWRHKCMHTKSMWQINFKSFSQILKRRKKKNPLLFCQFKNKQEKNVRFQLTIVLSELKPDSEHVPSNFS